MCTHTHTNTHIHTDVQPVGSVSDECNYPNFPVLGLKVVFSLSSPMPFKFHLFLKFQNFKKI